MFTLRLPPGRLLLALCAANCVVAADAAWQPLFNGKDLAGWTTWLAKPHASADLPGEPKDGKGAYTRPLGAGRDPLQVFTIVNLDGAPAIRVSGQVFGGITTANDYSNYRLRLQFNAYAVGR